MNIAILGFGIQGMSAYHYWRSSNNITVCDKSETLVLPGDVTPKLGAAYLEDLDEFDLIVRSPGIHPDDIANANSEAILEKVTTPTNEFFKVSPTKNIIGVTGTKGKGTTSALIANMLETAGKPVHLGGNIGVSPLDMLPDIQPDDWVVLELANFQLIDVAYSPHIAVCLMVVSEHLDWHETHEEYIASKRQLFAHQAANDIAIYFAENEDSKQIATAGEAQKIPYFQAPGAEIVDGAFCIQGETICNVDELKLLGKHNWQNACAAITAAWQVTQDVTAMHAVLANFGGLENRLEFVREIDGTHYYNDSFGTAPETAIVAIQAFDEPKVIILGGSDKGADYSELAKVIASSGIRKVVLIGEQAGRIRLALEQAGITDTIPGGNTIEQIVATAQAQAQPGDVVLFSPACASFDMFKNYKDRGEKFRRAVLAAA